MSGRRANITRTTECAEVKVRINLDGDGLGVVQTGAPFLDRMLSLFARYGAFDLEVECRAGNVEPDALAEEVALCLGMAIDRALGDRKGILRLAHSYAPVEENLARAAVDISGHPCLVYHPRPSVPSAVGPDALAAGRFWRAFVAEARITLHLELVDGKEGLPAHEALFKAAARALRDAVRIKGAE
jgi:imidazoleglycerol-phosphate dehydratase